MKQVTQKLTLQKSSRLLVDSIIAILIVSTPFIFYSYMCFPDVKIWKTHLFTYESKFYESVNTFAWVFMQKFVFLFLMLIWFFTCSRWWRKALLVPIGMLVYQIIILLNDEIFFKDELTDKYVILPLVISICIILFLIHKKLLFYIKAIDLKEEIDLKIEKIKNELHNEKN